jgi:hypothetical protein
MKKGKVQKKLLAVSLLPRDTAKVGRLVGARVPDDLESLPCRYMDF